MQAPTDQLGQVARCAPGVREDVLRDPRYPMHRIADKLLPYLIVLQDQFQPEEVIVFGSYAYGIPDDESDVDLLVIKRITQSRLKDKVAIRSAWWPLLRENPPLSFDLMLAAPEERLMSNGRYVPFYSEIFQKGVRVL
jgi:predicted nucleotidyltransferase